MPNSSSRETSPILQQTALEPSTTTYGSITQNASPKDPNEPSGTPPLRRPRIRRASVSIAITLDNRRNVVFFVIIILLIVFAVDVGAFMVVAPFQRIWESILCRSYYQEHDPSRIGWDGNVEEVLCKIPPVQKQLAKLRGWSSTMDCLPALIFTIPYGILADKIGRKPVAVMSLCGVLATQLWVSFVSWFPDVFSLYLVLAGPLLQVLGGGSGASIFFQISAATQISSFISYPLAAVTMQRTPWLSLAIALIFFVSGILLVFLLPETLPEQPRSRSPESPKSASDHDNNNELSSSPSTSKLSSSLDALTASICSLITSTTTLLSSRPSALLLTIFLAAGFTLSATVTFLLQYTSERFTWSVAHASIFPTTESLTKTLLLTLALPLLKRYLSSASPPPPPPSAASSSSSPTTLPTHRAQKTDRLLLSTSLALTATGLSLLPFAPTPALALLATVLFSLGAGFHSLARSLLSSVVPADNVGRAFALAATVQMVGTAAAGPVLGGVYAWGLERGGVWRGSVWWVAGGVVWVVGMGVWGVGVEGQESAVGNWDHQGEGRGRRGLRRERERERQREGDEESLSGREDDGDDEEAEDEGEGEGVGDRDRDGGGRGEERRNLLRRH